MKNILTFQEFVNESYINEANHWNFKEGDTVTVLSGKKAVKAKIIKIDLDRDSALLNMMGNASSGMSSLTYPLDEIYPKNYNLVTIKHSIEQNNNKNLT
jgi:hypothetical protein